ncbi:MAG: sugar transferase [Ignavibacteriae bacterium]|nr:sugar transferase [Ignavibacteriota bacterium]MCB9244070.1 sugar transferase [Ignavibacteriales bacterium]
MLKRIFDVVVSFTGLVILSPFLIIIAIIVVIDSKGGVFFLQDRVGKNGKVFKIIKFRTMTAGSDKESLLTIGQKDSRITRAGYFLRKFKIDEIPQLINVLKSDMSFVGPRPEVEKYVALYNEEQLKVLTVRPGITDFASIQYKDESTLLANADDPEIFYISDVMPTKLKLNIDYINNRNFMLDVKIIFKTILEIFR